MNKFCYEIIWKFGSNYNVLDSEDKIIGFIPVDIQVC